MAFRGGSSGGGGPHGAAATWNKTTVLLNGIVLLLCFSLLANLAMNFAPLPSSSSAPITVAAPPPPPIAPPPTYYLVGVRDDPDFAQSVAQAWRLQDLNPGQFLVRSFALPSEEALARWQTESAPALAGDDQVSLSDSRVLVFRESQLLGSAIASLKLDLKQQGLKWMLPRPVASPPPPQAAKDKEEEEKEPAPQSSAAFIQPSLPITTTVTDEDLLLPIQLTLKSEIVTGYRVNPDKQFTNYRPLAQHLQDAYHWQWMLQAPLPAGLILVQDQTTAATVNNKYPKSMLNNIGWGGQSCLGGTKGTQLACRAAKALQDGCDYEQLRVQPAHYRLWIADECQYFFNDVCQESAQQNASTLFIQKPSGGQHGQGIKVHQGCDQLRVQFPDCANEQYMLQHKYFISPYITPVLLDGHKFDMRTFALIGSLDPLLCFYADGFVRKATSKFTLTNLKDSAAHVTNSLSQDLKEDHFWDFTKLNQYLNDHARHHRLGRDFVFQRFRNRAKRVTEFFFRAAQQVGFKKQRGRFQVFAADWIVDDLGWPYLLEVNSNPLVASTPPKGLERVFPRQWGELMDLVLKIHVGKGGQLVKKQLVPYKYTYHSWHLVLNQEMRPEYKTCDALKPDEPNTKADTILCPNARFTGVGKRRCTLAAGTVDETEYHVLQSEVQGPTVVVLAGLHGKESAGVLAARYVAQKLFPRRGTFVIVERANARGVRIFKRYVPSRGSSSNNTYLPPYDLNRAFTAQSVISGTPLVIALWKLLLNVQPDYYFDLHEGRAFFSAFLANYHHTLPQTVMIDNVGATTGAGSVSKGNSVVTSVNAYPLAQEIADAANERIPERRQKIFVMGPPIEGGLAAMLSSEFSECKIMLFESTQTNELPDRAKQHLFMLSVALKSEDMLDEDFNADLAEVESCVVTRSDCDLPLHVDEEGEEGETVMEEAINR